MRALVVTLLCLVHVATADAGQVLVLKAEGTADASARTSVDAHVLKLAKNIDGKVDAGEITLSEAAALVGCNPADTSCKDEVLSTLGADEVIATTVTATPTGLNITVRRISRGNSRAAQTTIAAGKPADAKLDSDIGPLFGLVVAAPKPEPKPEPKPVTPPPPPTTTPPTTTAPPPPPVVEPAPQPVAPVVTAAPTGAVAPTPPENRRSRRLSKIGLAAGGGFVLLGFLMWAGANDIQAEIDDKPEPRTPADFAELRDLEKQGDDLAGVGNLFFLTGVVTGGISAYFYWRAGKSSSTTATVAPAAYPQGAGVTLTIGGLP
jgi:outer membrane biosynthesis protein TonB